ncbi:MAG TPA: hypothetical protein VH760_02595 [Gaiellaceae bacterium]|jgi:hypothetical protein
MASIGERLAAAIAGVPFVQLPEGWDGGPINIPGLTGGLPLDDPWDTVASASAPGLSGDEVRFAVTRDGRTISGGDASPDALDPLARAVGARIDPPFWAVAVPDDGDDWTAAGTAAEVLEMAGAAGDDIEASRVGGETSGRVDGEDANVPAEITALLQQQDGDTAIVAHRFAGPVWVAEVYPL